jgi:hypothetical protein
LIGLRATDETKFQKLTPDIRVMHVNFVCLGQRAIQLQIVDIFRSAACNLSWRVNWLLLGSASKRVNRKKSHCLQQKT